MYKMKRRSCLITDGGLQSRHAVYLLAAMEKSRRNGSERSRHQDEEKKHRKG